MIGTPAACIACRARVFEPISSIAAGGGPIQTRPGRLDRPREECVLGQEAVPGMHGLRAGALGSLEQLLDDEVALGGGQAPERVRLVGGRDVPRRPVGVGVDGNRADSQLAQGAEDPNRDLTPVRDEDFPEHTPYSPDG